MDHVQPQTHSCAFLDLSVAPVLVEARIALYDEVVDNETEYQQFASSRIQSVRDLIPLGSLPVGRRAEVCTITGLNDHTRRLQELGFRQGVEVEILRSGNPCIVRLDNSRFCVRDSEVSSILVKK